MALEPVESNIRALAINSLHFIQALCLRAGNAFLVLEEKAKSAVGLAVAIRATTGLIIENSPFLQGKRASAEWSRKRARLQMVFGKIWLLNSSSGTGDVKMQTNLHPTASSNIFSGMKWSLVWLLAAAGTLLAADSQKEEAKFIKNARQLTFEGKTGEGYFSPDGRQLVFQSERETSNPYYQIYLLDLTSGDSHRLSTGEGKTTCAFIRPNSDEVLFSSTHLDPETHNKQKAEIEFRASGQKRRYSWDYDEAMDIFSVTRDGKNLKRLTDAQGYDAEASYSPDGKKIVFCSTRQALPLTNLSPEERKRYETDPAYFGDLYIMNADGSEVKQLTTEPGYDGGPFFTADGERIVWRRFEENGMVADIYSMKLDGSEVRRLTQFSSMSWAPYPHPSGEYVIFASNKQGFENFELYLVDSEGAHEPVRVTFTEKFDGLPVFSPDGKKLCWTSNRTGNEKSQLFFGEWNHEAALGALSQSPAPQSPDSQPHTATKSSATSLHPEIRAEDAQKLVEILASDEMEGRKTAEKGSARAAEFLVEQIRKYGLQPGKNGSFLHPFDFPSGSSVITNGTSMSLKLQGNPQASSTHENSNVLQLNKDFIPFSFSETAQITGPVVFVGYGISKAGKPGEGYDSYAGINVSNKIVLALRYVPEGVESKRREELLRNAALREKAITAKERGAKGIIIVTGPNSPNAGELIPWNDRLGTSVGIPAVSVTADTAAKLLASTGKNLKDLQTALDTENPHATSGLEIPKVEVHLKVALKYERQKDHNVIGIIPPKEGMNEYVMLGAHFDHLGIGKETEPEAPAGSIFNGADDNASGVAAVLEIAAALAAEKNNKRGVIVAFWSGEELGLIGSGRYAANPIIPLEHTVAYLNFDMVGRLKDNKFNLQGVGSSSVWRKLIERRNVAAGFNLVLQEDPYLPTDTTSFYPKNIPVLAFFTGVHDDYHKPSDDADKVNYEGIERIATLGKNITLDLVNAESRPDYLRVAKNDSGEKRDSLRAYLGTIPDYSTEVKGVPLSGVRSGSPADKAGLLAKDILIEFGGKKIETIYDYTSALDAAKIGQPVEVIVQRDGKPVKLTVTPEVRK